MIGGYGRGVLPATKNLLIINLLFFLATYAFEYSSIADLTIELGAFYPDSDYFKPWQIITHMFMHGGLAHIFFNMFALWMFGSSVEQAVGTKKFLFLYFFSGLGAYFLYNLFHFYEAQEIIRQLPINDITLNDIKSLPVGNVYSQNKDLLTLSSIYTVPMVGASGALYGILVAFGVLYPNAQLMLLFPPIPMKAKYFIPILILIELFQQYQNNPQDNVAHLAHLGGALFGFIFIRKWKQNRFRVN
ncbi:MAG: rhomboid family intramembrane serine protease [Flavobacteriales bacterium]